MILIILEGFTVPCGRGDTESGYLFRLIMYLIPVIITPAIIVSTMIIMYRTVPCERLKERCLATGPVHCVFVHINDPPK